METPTLSQPPTPMSKVVNYYKDLDLKKLVLSKPEKQECEKITHISNLTLDKVNLCIIQTPNLIYTKSEKTLSFELSKNQEFYSFTEKLKDRITEILYNNSEKFFKGKKFSYNYIYKAISTFVNIDGSGLANLINIEMSEDIKIFDHFKELVEPTEHTGDTAEGIFILNIKNIEFSGKSIKINIDIDAIKLKFRREIITDVCLLEDSESEDIDLVEQTDSESVGSSKSEESEQDFFS